MIFEDFSIVFTASLQLYRIYWNHCTISSESWEFQRNLCSLNLFKSIQVMSSSHYEVFWMIFDAHLRLLLIFRKCYSRRFSRSSCGDGSQIPCIDLQESASHFLPLLEGVLHVIFDIFSNGIHGVFATLHDLLEYRHDFVNIVRILKSMFTELIQEHLRHI